MSGEVKLTGMEQLRQAVAGLNNCNETFLEVFSAEELLMLHRAWCASAWMFYPDEWASRQVFDALRGIVPDWDGDERPIYHENQKRIT